MVSRDAERGHFSDRDYCRLTQTNCLIVEVFPACISHVARWSQCWYRYSPYPGPSLPTIAIPSSGDSPYSQVYFSSYQYYSRYWYQLPMKFHFLKIEECVWFLRRILFKLQLFILQGSIFFQTVCVIENAYLGKLFS